MSTEKKNDSLIDQCCMAAESALETLCNKPPSINNPADKIKKTAPLTPEEKQHSGRLMRINHVGEICAQALYHSQSLTTKNPVLKKELLEKAYEEKQHLGWCQARLDQLDSKPSKLNALWYAGAFLMGAASGLSSQAWGLGFIQETERQVEAHLDNHLNQLSKKDKQSRAIVKQMCLDEKAHADWAKEHGAKDLPEPLKKLMHTCANTMKKIAYWL